MMRQRQQPPPMMIRKDTIQKVLFLIVGLTLMTSFRFVYLGEEDVTQRLSTDTTVQQLQLDQFRPRNQSQIYKDMNDINNLTSMEDILRRQDSSEPFPIVLIPYVGSVDPFYNISSDGSEDNLWDKDPSLPEWMKAYFNWHKYKRQHHLHPDTWMKERWMVIQCLKDHDAHHCGGTADRLKPFPTLLRIAYENHRFLIIRWTKPTTLETFLIPPKGGFDWRAPIWMENIIDDPTIGRRFVPSKMIRQYAATNLTVLRTRYQSDIAGKDQYDRARYDDEKEPDFEQVFSALWRISFRPSPPIERIIQDQLQSNGLIPGHYVSAHLRALYKKNVIVPVTMLGRMARHSVECASMLRPGAPIFFASDSSQASDIALRYATEKNATLIIHRPNPNPPLHIDFREQKRGTMIRPPSDYFDTFVDLYLLSLAECVSYTEGGYGHWGLLIGGNITCSNNAKWFLRSKSFETPCTWMSGEPPVIPVNENPTGPLFLEPML